MKGSKSLMGLKNVFLNSRRHMSGVSKGGYDIIMGWPQQDLKLKPTTTAKVTLTFDLGKRLPSFSWRGWVAPAGHTTLLAAVIYC